MSPQKLTIGLALSGGAARGIAHVGILQAFENAGLTIDYLAGTSAGALAAAMYASGVSLAEMTAAVLRLTWRDLFAPHLTLKSLVSNKRVLTYLQKHCRVARFEDLQIPLAVAVSDLATGRSVTITDGALFPAIQASCSIPLLCPPVRLNGQDYIDGGFAAQIPVAAARALGADLVIACDVNYNANLPTRPGNFLTLLIHLMQLISRRSAEDAKAQADFVINVDVRGIRLTDFHKGQELIARGIQATEKILPQLQKKW